MALALSDVGRHASRVHFGTADLFAYDSATTKYISFGYAQDTTLEISWEQAELLAGSPQVIVDTEYTRVNVTLTTKVLELSAFNIAKLLPTVLTQSTTGATIESYNESITFPALPAKVKVRFPNVVDAGVDPDYPDPKVWTIDGTLCVEGVDYAWDTLATGEIKLVAGSLLLSTGSQAKVQYFYDDTTASVIHMGGRQCSSTAKSFTRLRAISRSKACAYRGVEIYKAVPQSPLSIPFGNSHSVVEAKFMGQDDEDQPIGQNLFRFILGSDAQV